MDDMNLFVPITNTSISAARRCGWTKPLERSSAAGQIAYLEFQFGLFGKGAYEPKRAIEKVVLGPKCPLSLTEVTDALNHNGFENFQVLNSECQIR